MPESKGVNGVDLDSTPDLTPWERHASVKRIENQYASVELILFPLLTSFLGHMTLPVLMSGAYVAESPHTLEDIDVLDDSVLGMTAKLLRWLPLLRKDSSVECLARKRPEVCPNVDVIDEQMSNLFGV